MMMVGLAMVTNQLNRDNDGEEGSQETSQGPTCSRQPAIIGNDGHGCGGGGHCCVLDEQFPFPTTFYSRPTLGLKFRVDLRPWTLS